MAICVVLRGKRRAWLYSRLAAGAERPWPGAIRCPSHSSDATAGPSLHRARVELQDLRCRLHVHIFIGFKRSDNPQLFSRIYRHGMGHTIYMERIFVRN